jgi:hypothetical protein
MIVTRINEGTEHPHYPFRGKSGINVNLEDANNPLDFWSVLIIIPEFAKLISTETNNF